MSYSIYLKPTKERCEHCGSEQPWPDCPSPTYNLTPIFDLALTGEGLPSPQTPEVEVVLFGTKTERPRGLRLLNGQRAGDTKDQIGKALTRLYDSSMVEAFNKLAPENGWGTVDDATKVFGDLLRLAEAHPDHVWEIH